MLFKDYYKIMKEHGIGELVFLYDNKKCAIRMEIINFSLNYSIYFCEEFDSSDDFDEIVSLKYLSIEKTLEEIWDEIKILSIDGVSENDYDVKTCSYDYVERLRQIGVVQWSYSHSVKATVFMFLPYMIIGALIVPTLSILLPLFGIGNWNVVLMAGILAVLVLIVSIVAISKSRVSIVYNITTKRIFTFNGLSFETTYDNIKKVKLRRSIFKKGYGSVKVYVKKGWSPNYHLENIPNPEEVYNIIMINIQQKRKED